MRGSHFPAAVLPSGDGGSKPRTADDQRPCLEQGVPPLDPERFSPGSPTI